VPRAAPVLVLAVPAAESAASTKIASGITSVVGVLCPRADIQVGYDGDREMSLSCLLASIVAAREGEQGAGDDECPYAAVVIPLAVTPDPDRDAALANAVAQAGPAVTRTAHLGPHPLLAAALHDRLAEAGLVQARRISGLSLVETAMGVLVGVAGGEPALRAAETVCVLLTARLGVLVAAVSVSSRNSMEDGVARLREAGASRFALAPYLVGPEISPAELATIAAGVGAECALPLGSHHAIGQLVTMRYGAALLDHRPPGAPPPGPPPAALLGRVTPRTSRRCPRVTSGAWPG
jgi:hypothetical protein